MPPVVNVEIILNTESGQMTMRGPTDPLALADVLTNAIKTCLVTAAKQRASQGPTVTVAGAAALRALPPETNGSAK